jgi:2'-5' RNA ligase
LPESASGPGPIRAFLAVDAPWRVPADLAEALGLPGRAASAHHLTLRFLGSLGWDDLAKVMAACREIEAPALRLAIQGLGLFRQAHGRATLWAGLAPSRPLSELKQAVDAALGRSLGWEPERSYVPHLTIARLKGGAGLAARLVREAEGKALGEFEAAELKLYKSELGPGGAVHSALAAWPLAGPPRPVRRPPGPA